jgi:hypothetical protein
MAYEPEILITRSGLQAWHKYESGVSANGLCNDYSGNGRHLVQASTPPILTSNVINGQSAWAFDGTKNPLVYTGSVTTKHIFVVGSSSEVTFPDFRGLLSNTVTFAILTGDPASTKFGDTQGAGIFASTYRKNNVVYANANQQAPMNGAFALMEVQIPLGLGLSGIQVGHPFTLAGAQYNWRGNWVEQFFYDRVLSESDRQDLYEYIATKFRIWSQNAAGLKVFPFSPNWPVSLDADKRVISSTAVSGASKGRSKGTKKRTLDAQFGSRMPEEYTAALAFWDEHYPGTSFIYRDESISPSEDIEMKFVSRITKRGNDFRDVDYTFQAVEV